MNGEPYEIALIRLLSAFEDVQTASGEEIISKKAMYIPTLTEFRDIVNRITDYDYLQRLRVGAAKSKDKSLVKCFVMMNTSRQLSIVYNRLNEIINNQDGILC